MGSSLHSSDFLLIVTIAPLSFDLAALGNSRYIKPIFLTAAVQLAVLHEFQQVTARQDIGRSTRLSFLPAVLKTLEPTPRTVREGGSTVFMADLFKQCRPTSSTLGLGGTGTTAAIRLKTAAVNTKQPPRAAGG